MRETIRQATREDIPGIARVHVDSWRTTYRGIVPDEVLTCLSYERREHGWEKRWDEASDKNLVLVALNQQGRIIGFAEGGPEREGDPRYVGEVYAIYLLQAYQRQGLGRRLISQIMQYLVAQGLLSMLIWALVENPAGAFYEHLGGQQIKTRQIEIGGKALVEVAFGWHDIRLFPKFL